MSETRLMRFVPILFVRDVPSSAEFFNTKLGFKTDFLYGEPPFYGGLSRDDVCIHLRCVRQPNFAELAAPEISLIFGLYRGVRHPIPVRRIGRTRRGHRPAADQTGLGRNRSPCSRPRRQCDFLCQRRLLTSPVTCMPRFHDLDNRESMHFTFIALRNCYSVSWKFCRG